MARTGDPAIGALLQQAAEMASAYVAAVDGRPVAPGAEALAGLDRFDEPLADQPCDPQSTLALLDDAGSPATVASTGGRYFGFVTGATLPVALASSFLAGAWDQNSALPVMSPVAAKLHEVTAGWLREILSLPATTAVSFVSGATMANATCLTAARDAQLAAAGWDAQADGLFGAPPVTVVLGGGAHSTLSKGLGMLGLGRSRVVVVPADDQGRLRPEDLPGDIRPPVVVCLQAGEVNTGAFDPFAEIIPWARERGAWVHVDGAFGLWALAAPGLRPLIPGLTDADSWATDAHKWLNVTYDSGIAFVRRPADLRRSFASSAAYLPPEDAFEAMHQAPQSSQRARAIEVWAVLRTLGRQGLAALVEGSCRQAKQLAEALHAQGLHILNDVVLNQVLVRAGTDEATTRLIDAVQEDGTCWCGPTVWQGRPAMRVSVSGWATTDDDIARSVDAIARAHHRLEHR